MSEEEFESYLRLMGRFLKLNDRQRDAIKIELRDHLEERLDELIAGGHSREQAIEAALDEFGDAAAIASDFGKIGRRRKWIMRTATSTVGLAATVLIVSFLLPENRPTVPAPAYTQAQNSPDEKTPALKTSPAAATADADPDAILDRVLPWEYEETPFAEAIAHLRQQLRINVHVNWWALEDAGLDRGAPITISLRDVPFRQGLDLMLLEAASGEDLLAYHFKGNVLMISTKERLGENTEVRIYDCRDLMTRLPVDAKQGQARASNAPTRLSSAMGGQPPQSEALSSASTLLNHPALRMTQRPSLTVAAAAGLTDDRRPDHFVDMITNTIASDSWTQNGGIASISQYDGFLIVRQTPPVHAEIEDLLAMLRDAVAKRQPKPAAAMPTDPTAPGAAITEPRGGPGFQPSDDSVLNITPQADDSRPSPSRRNRRDSGRSADDLTPPTPGAQANPFLAAPGSGAPTAGNQTDPYSKTIQPPAETPDPVAPATRPTNPPPVAPPAPPGQSPKKQCSKF